MPYFEKIATAGITEVHYSYHSRSRPEPGAGKRWEWKEPTPKLQRKNNIWRSMQRSTLDLNESSGPDCWYTTWNYTTEDQSKDKKELTSQITKVLRKLRNIYHRNSKVLKYVWVSEVGPRGGSHIHTVVSLTDVRLIKDVWPYGGLHFEPMCKDWNYRKLVGYFIEYSELT